METPVIERESKENESPNIPKVTAVEYSFRKNKTPVSIPPTLTLHEFENSGQDDKVIQQNDTTISKEYSIQSIVHHIGSRASSGHYTADALRLRPSQNSSEPTESEENDDPNELSSWVSFDDGQVGMTSLDKILNSKFKQETAYMVLYSLSS